MSDEQYMQRCLEIAELGMGEVSPNPMVGCVIVHNDIIIGEGYHRKFGEAHAEVNAVHAVFSNYPETADSLLSDSTVYVSLEPCAHFGKTPPCADLLIKHKVKKVIIGNTDPFIDVNGKGITKLKEAGIEVISGILEDKCTELNRRFFTRVNQQRPFIILKWAETANGYFAPKNTLQEWISGPLAKKLVHKWRTEEDAVLVGKYTAIYDNPQLTTREWQGNNPIRIVIDKKLQVPVTHHVYNDVSKTLVFNEVKTIVEKNIHYIQMEDMQYYLPQKIAFQLYLMDIQSVIIEGGANLLSQFITAGLWDEARVFNSATSWQEGIQAPNIYGVIKDQINVGLDRLTIYTNGKLS
ncbi:MAG: bifunctional diaminohydroxyphosphoribosylaminopyrimidine deaminase/5-amino-6-(5-phosphoribosylamino)uracil reductase RibD [Flavobacterium sp.]|nr:MAG: bifunctional diaminohydroxyphosphoribosylaminopyrimidine deaminase/5-amino-6-(5-phosphoribosylamino)uracil reductase RibD [Flavobacterium sp.]